MTTTELENKKNELIEKVESWLYAGEEAKAIKALIIKLLKGTGVAPAFLMQPAPALKVSSPLNAEREREVFMTRNEKMASAKQLAALLINTLKEIKLSNDEELSALYLALNVSNFEEIEDSKMYCLAADADFNSDMLKNAIEEFESAAKSLYGIKL